MSGFITKAACLGRRPSQFAAYGGYQRANLIARLLGNRSVARFLVAPTGYGKSTLLVDYAETVFSWSHVFWINGTSPCFLRDLDEGSIARDCLELDASARLVVIDDLPVLDLQRAESLSRQIDELLSEKCEVVVACTPSADMFSKVQRDRIRIGAHDFLLSDDEIEEVGLARSFGGADAPSRFPEPCRVPALLWRTTEESKAVFLRGIFKEQIPADLSLAMTTMLVLQAGSLASVGRIVSLDMDALVQIGVDYPHLGLDVDAGSFETSDFSIDEIAAALRGQMEPLVSCSGFGGREQLAWAWAETLAESKGDYGRACDVVRRLCPNKKKVLWLTEHAEDIVRSASFREGASLAAALHKSTYEGASKDKKAVCVTLEAVCLALLGESDAAVLLAKRHAFELTMPADVRTCCLAILAQHAPQILRSRAEDEIDAMALSFSALDGAVPPRWEALLLLWHASRLGLEEFVQLWCAFLHDGADETILLIAAARLFTMVSRFYEGNVGASIAPPVLQGISAAEDFVRAKIDALGDAELDFFVASAGLSLERAHASGMRLEKGPLPTAVLLQLRHMEVVLLTQQSLFREERHSAVKLRDEPASPRQAADFVRSSSGYPSVSLQRSVPLLQVHLFGRFEVSIGGTPVDEKMFHRRHVRLLLLLLTANLGRDVSRNKLATQLWPDVSEKQATRNLYAAWSKLRRALSLADGSCPYLSRHRFGCSLEEKYVRSDIARLDEICRQLLFDNPGAQGWTELYAEIERDFSHELLPSEDNCELVDRMRADYQNRLVDALISSTQSIIDSGSPKVAIWFARAALARDEIREDAYVALMNAQIAASQRTAAMMTYLTCRRVLAERLGVDPSPETTALYESLLDGE